MRRNLGLAVILGIFAGGVLWSSGVTLQDLVAAEPAKTRGAYVHTVIMTLKPDAPSGALQGLIDDAHTLLAKVPAVREVRVGKPAAEATPDFAAKDYHLGLLVLFDDTKGLKEYLDHPLHTQYVQKHLPNVAKIVVYDFEQTSK
jgi:hypothetical protein